MRCPHCEYNEDKVVDSRTIKEGSAIRRRRECLNCGKRFTTYEYIERAPLMVVKRDGRREVYSREKLLTGLLKACERRPIPREQLEKLVDEIESATFGKFKQEIRSTELGNQVMEKLEELDHVAYVRFASVYRQFKDINQFMKELKSLLDKSGKGGNEE
ncbi:MAG: transcriptional repressor NrdR [Candidatus Latescibacteria bacterium]|nr:transcriptional repressor NrdR [Candidatus Latescibacterota bacterium]NIO01012.1 transcriptional repressor NrdR [Candidatus Latescibacterota bacterium]NIO27411.1 transcriptional repressor NrdR [Candidatus Latescibacterota bacterium]NIO54933.1 transcriptional repressor NrdR [Candidatus Latescibacterota bacterium]NIT01022.1 transcriptional repressor NrdR [Candidatus Latescibacterota bacterium]